MRSISSSGYTAMATARSTPTASAPTKAPRMLPRPPITTTAKASTISSMPISLMAAGAGIRGAPDEGAQRGPRGEHPHVDASHVHAERLRHFPVVCARPHDAAEGGAGQEPADRAGDEEAGRDDDEVVDGHRRVQQPRLPVHEV